MSFFRHIFSPKNLILVITGAFCGVLTAQFYLNSGYKLDIFAITKHAKKDNSIELLASPWNATGDKSLSEKILEVKPELLIKNNTIRITYNSYGMCLLEGKAASITLENDQDAYPLAISHYGKNCSEKEQTIDIPLNHFIDSQKLKTVKNIRISFWFSSVYRLDVSNILLTTTVVTDKPAVLGKKVKISAVRNIRPTFVLRSAKRKNITPPIDSTATSIPSIPSLITDAPIELVPDLTSGANSADPIRNSWTIQSISSMKETKDKICTPDSEEFITQWVDKAKKLGANYVSIETPYDSPECGDSLAYTKTWIRIVRSRGLHVWHRHMPISFEGIYDTKKLDGIDYLAQIRNYIKANKDDFQENDIFTPIPEPQNGGISGITHCPDGVCQFSNPAHFNRWLRSSMDVVDTAFAEINLKDKINIGFFGFDGFVAWGDNNPDWDGILEDETIAKMGNITIDHYPEVVNDTMEHDLNELQAKYPNVPIMIGEWGTISEGNLQEQVIQTMKAARRPNVIGFNYWNLGIGGNESLIKDDFTEREHFSTVQSFFHSTL